MINHYTIEEDGEAFALHRRRSALEWSYIAKNVFLGLFALGVAIFAVDMFLDEFSWKNFPWIASVMIPVFLIGSVVIFSKAWELLSRPTKNLMVFSGYNLRVLNQESQKPLHIPLEDIERLFLISDKKFDDDAEKLVFFVKLELQRKDHSRELIHIFNPTQFFVKNDHDLQKELREDSKEITEILAKKMGVPLRVLKG